MVWHLVKHRGNFTFTLPTSSILLFSSKIFNIYFAVCPITSLHQHVSGNSFTKLEFNVNSLFVTLSHHTLHFHTNWLKAPVFFKIYLRILSTLFLLSLFIVPHMEQNLDVLLLISISNYMTLGSPTN